MSSLSSHLVWRRCEEASGGAGRGEEEEGGVFARRTECAGSSVSLPRQLFDVARGVNRAHPERRTCAAAHSETGVGQGAKHESHVEARGHTCGRRTCERIYALAQRFAGFMLRGRRKTIKTVGFWAI